MNETKITFHHWQDPVASEIIKKIRYEVFVWEQKVPVDEEIDNFDPVSLHILAHVKIKKSCWQPAGTGRLIPNGHIGRLAVLKKFRRMGIGRTMMTALEKKARDKGFTSIELDAQLQAIPFYEEIGYMAFGGEFTDAGILHRKMKKQLLNNNNEHL